jgi:hypothetical protein
VTTPTAPTLDTISDTVPVAGGVFSVTADEFPHPKGLTVDGVVITEWAISEDKKTLSFVAPAHAAGEVDLVIDGYWTGNPVKATLTYA